MLQPTTPSKADDEIESIKLSLTAKWGIVFPARDSGWSPSRRDPNCLEDQILKWIQFLYWNGGALGYAVEEFESNAVKIHSQWQFKPRGDADVLPSREAPQSALRHDFLHKRVELGEAAVKELTESLRDHLSHVVGRVRNGENFPKPTVEKPRAASIVPVTKPLSARRQSSITQWFRSKSVPETKTTVQQASSDDYHDEEMADIFDQVAPSPSLAAHDRRNQRPTIRAQQFFTPGIIETQRLTPPKSEAVGLGLEIAESELPEAFYRKKPETIPIVTRKRACPEPMKPPMPNKVSRETRSHRTAYNIDHLQPTSKPDEQVYPSLAGPTSPPETSTSVPGSLGTNRSSDNLVSLSTSFTSVSTTWTSPNTSFRNDSIATSFSSNIGETDGMTSAAIEVPGKPLSNSKSTLQSGALPIAGQSVSGAQNIRVGSSHGDPMDVDVQKTPAINLSLGLGGVLGEAALKIAESDFEGLLATRLRKHSPFLFQDLEQYAAVPFRNLYEILRVANHSKLDFSRFSACLSSTYGSYDELWSSLRAIVQPHGVIMPERSDLTAWDRAGTGFHGVALTGKLSLLNQQKGPMWGFALHPLKIESTYRLSRRFGSDRFFILVMPGLDRDGLPPYLRANPGPARETIIKWLVECDHYFLGRKWRVFYPKPEFSKKSLKAMKGKADKHRHRVYFFAEDGIGFRQEPPSGETDPRILDRPIMTVEDMIEWMMPSKLNEDQPCLKFFARLALGVSSTTPSVVFKPDEIFRADDARADSPCQRRLNRKRSDEKKTQTKKSKSKSPVTNDGCARISRNAAYGIAESLGLDRVPCVFQGRIGGAKGMWMIDLLDETPPSLNTRNFWIEITDSQLKFEGHSHDAWDPDPARVTFEVNDYAKKLVPGSLNFQLLPILEDRKVPAQVFINLLEKDLTARVAEMEVAMDSGLALRKWNQTNNPISEERAQFGGIEMHGGLPQSTAEKINWFVEHGFEPKTCRYLQDQLYQAIRAYCLRLESKMNIGLAESTYALMIADPLVILEENEVHIAFSSSFKDHKTGVDQAMLHDIDVLVARLPAHLPSDIQKVRAVFKPELRVYRDVIVFPSKGPVSLASKLSGGDYDGDRAWVCWDSDIVEPFQNAEVPPHRPVESYGINVDKTKVADMLPHNDYMNRFLCHAFNFNLQMNMVGTCTLYHEAYCYREKAIDSDQAVAMAALLGHLVDSTKGGFKYDNAKWAEYKKNHCLPQTLPTPAYKDRNKARPTNHLIDHLVFVTAKKTGDEVLRKFSKHFQEVSERDEDLFRVFDEAAEETRGHKELVEVLKNLEAGLKVINTFWRKHVQVGDDDENRLSSRKPSPLTFSTLVERCREDFLKLSPTLRAPAVSDKIASWQREHTARRSSDWDRLKASVAFHHYCKTRFVWHIAGVELGEIKATARGRGTYRIVTGEIHEAFKLDSRAVRKALRREMLMGEDYDKMNGNFDEYCDFGDLDIDVDDL